MTRPIASAVFVAAVLSAALAARASADFRTGFAGMIGPDLLVSVTVETAAGAGIAVAVSAGGD
jgi:hypothetical protein